MKLTKYGHACLVLEEQGKKLIVDPGAFTPEWGDNTNVLAIVITHVHADHFKPENLQAILAASPEAQIFTTGEVAEQYKQASVTVVTAGQTQTVGSFTLRFGSEMHATIHATLPIPQNISVTINDKLYYPGDSYTMPDGPVDVLAVPGNAPWMKVADSMDYIAKVKPQRCFPTHNGLLSGNGTTVYNFGLEAACKANEVTFVPLKPGESLEV